MSKSWLGRLPRSLSTPATGSFAIALQVGQATNQLLAFSTKQQLQIQSLLAAHYRAEAFEQARRLQAETDARAAAVKFLGTGEAYNPK